jgi:3-oxoacyl-[acyl-carrier protein] reductase
MILNSDRLLEGKIALLTGCGRGIGRATLELFAAQGAKIYANARKEGSIDELCSELSNRHQVEVTPLIFDVTDYSAVKSAIQQIFKETHRLDVLVNNAGILQASLLGMVTPELLEATYRTNVFGTMYTMQYASRLMSRQKSGSIINMSSIMGANGAAGQTVYSGSKAAVIGLTKSAAKELAPMGIRVNAVAPGFIDTDMAREIPEDKFNERLASIGMGKIGTPEDVACCLLYLASELSQYVTGQVIGVDGAMLI